MSVISGTEKRETFTCPQCGGFLWTEGLCDTCAGHPFEKDTPSRVENVIYKRDDEGKVTTRKRKK